MIKKFKDTAPVIPNSCYVFPNATLIGNIVLGENVIIYPGCVIHAEQGQITIGDNTNVQENSTIHIEPGMDVHIGKGVTIGHNAILHGCTIGDNVLVGMCAIIQDGAVLEENTFLGAAALVKQGMVIPQGHVAYGFPAKVVRPISQEEYDEIRWSASEYLENLAEFKQQESETDV